MRKNQQSSLEPALSTQDSGLSTILQLPDPSLILLIGPSGAGKSTFAAAHFRPTEIVSSDRCRALICDDESDQTVNREAFEILHHLAAVRLRLKRLTVIDATNLQEWSRAQLLQIAQHHSTPAIAVVFNISLETALINNQRRASRLVDDEVINQHFHELKEAIPQLSREGYEQVYVVSLAELKTAKVVRERRVEKLISD